MAAPDGNTYLVGVKRWIAPLWLLAVAGFTNCSSKDGPPPEDSNGATTGTPNNLEPMPGFVVDDPMLLPEDEGTEGQVAPPLGPQCLGETYEAEVIGLDMYVMLDISASMLDVLPQTRLGPAPTKWDAVRRSFEDFVQAPETADIGIGIQYFPQVLPDVPFSCTTNAECGAGGPCSNSLCVVNGVLDAPNDNQAPLTFLTLAPGGPRNCASDADCGGPGESCRAMEGECVVRPNTSPQFPDGTFLNLSTDPNGAIVSPLCNEQADCAGLPTTACDQIGICETQPIVCSATLGCPPGAGACVAFPYGCQNQTRCEPEAYSAPAVEISAAATRGAELIGSLASQVPNGLTPTAPALAGALEHARVWAEANPGRQVVTVLATDGFPTQCAPLDIEAIAETARAAAQAPTPVRTFVIGVFGQADLGGDGQARLDAIARAGGTERAILVNTAGDVSRDFLDALSLIRDTTVSCEFRLETAGLDFDRVNLAVTDAAGAQTQLYNVGDAAACGDSGQGWYYVRDAEGNPTQINVCPGTCGQFMAGGVRADLQIGCATLIR